MRQAKSHCLRANYDASDAAIVYLAQKILKFSEQYSHADVRAIVGNYSDMRSHVQKLRKEVQEARNRVRRDDGGGPSKYRADFQPDIEKLIDYCEVLDANRHDVERDHWQNFSRSQIDAKGLFLEKICGNFYGNF